MSNVVRLRPGPQRDSRDRALHVLLPKFLGVLWESGKKDVAAPRSPISALVDTDITLGGLVLHPGIFVIHAYLLIKPPIDCPKVFSAHLRDHSVADSRHFSYWNG